MTNTALPPLPEPAYTVRWDTITQSAYTADQMHAYAQEAVRAALASKPDARMHAREAAQAQHVEALCHRVMSGYDEACQHERIAMTIHRESDPQEWLKQQRHATACRTDAQLALRELRAAALASSPQSPPVVEGGVRQALEELVRLRDITDGWNTRAANGDACTPADLDVLETLFPAAWKAARAALASPQSSPVAPDVDGLKEAVEAYAKAAYWRGAEYASAGEYDAAKTAAHAAIDALSAHGVKQPEPADALDARRYRWLRINSYVEVRCDSPRHPDWRPDALDAAIDAAMSKERPIHEARPDDRKEQT
jgi:tetratricopeptide (TPR) repeat protein